MVAEPPPVVSVVPEAVASFSLDGLPCADFCVPCVDGDVPSFSASRAFTSSRKIPIIVRTSHTFIQRVPTTLGSLFLKVLDSSGILNFLTIVHTLTPMFSNAES